MSMDRSHDCPSSTGTTICENQETVERSWNPGLISYGKRWRACERLGSCYQTVLLRETRFNLNLILAIAAPLVPP
jgi:hypothetical protein